MTLPIVLLEAAETDLDDAKEWYRTCHPSLEADFVLCVEETLQRIARNPLAYATVQGDFRRAFIHRFPYRIVFHPAADQITVVAVLHTSRNPRTWQRRGH
jgi:plasmid stabilization system protein ParE